MFVAFNAEEEGLVGSEHFVPMLLEDGGKNFGKLKGALIADEVAWPGRGGKEFRKAIFETKRPEGSPSEQRDDIDTLVDTLARSALLQNSTKEVPGDGLGDGAENFVVNYHGFGSDHVPFLDAGLPAVLLIERDDDYHSDTWGHSDKDTFAHVDLDYGAAMTRLALRTVASMATPKDVVTDFKQASSAFKDIMKATATATADTATAAAAAGLSDVPGLVGNKQPKMPLA
jgi:Zn-dependent M28 family amino/carboxypeptidase